MGRRWIYWECLEPTFYQGVFISLPLLLCAILLRLCVVWGKLPSYAMNTLASVLGLYALWWYYSYSVMYFIILGIVVYGVLVLVHEHKGVLVAAVSVLFIMACELMLASAADWHRVRGSFLVMVMKMIALGFDLEDPSKNKQQTQFHKVPDLLEYTSYCVFPATTIFGPFVTYREHTKFLNPSPLNRSWLVNVARGWFSTLVCLSCSVCIMPFLFTEPHWNRWLVAYSAAASFRYSHFFVSFLSEFTTVAAGIGYRIKLDGSHSWSEFRVVHPLAIELPRSLGTVVTNWNLPMHLFLKNYVFKPSRKYVGRFGAILLTYIASAMLHGLNFQLAAVLLSIGIYAYIENVLRYKLSGRLNACVLDRPCPKECQHTYKKGSLIAMFFNGSFTLLAIFHLAYLGLMFGVDSNEDGAIELEGYSMMHTLRKWGHLDFLSHWVALGSYLLSLIL